MRLEVFSQLSPLFNYFFLNISVSSVEITQTPAAVSGAKLANGWIKLAYLATLRYFTGLTTFLFATFLPFLPLFENLKKTT